MRQCAAVRMCEIALVCLLLLLLQLLRHMLMAVQWCHLSTDRAGCAQRGRMSVIQGVQNDLSDCPMAGCLEI